MAVETYGLVNTDVYPSLPFDTSNIGSGSAVTPDNITAYIAQGASQFTSALITAGVAYESLGDNQKQAVRQGVIAYAVWQALAKIGFQGSRWESWRQEYQRCLDDVRATPLTVGEGAGQVASNVDTTTPHPRRFSRAGSKW